MNKTQYWILNFVGGVCALLILANMLLGQFNEKAGQTLMGTQNQLNRAQQMDQTMRNLVTRIAQASRTESSLSNLLVRHELKINLNPESPAKPTP